MIGLNLGDYQIVEQIGQGGMATVYKAYESPTDRFVALKILPQQYSDDPTFTERFNREARALARLEHLHILPIHAYGKEDGITYLAMRYMPTGTLKDLIRQQGALPLSEAGRLLGQVASALDHAHKHGILHRDVKPANVLLDADKNAYLTDFGIARLVGVTADLTGGGVIGTPAYMPPEQLEGSDHVVPASDQYALGIVLYEMVTGRTPYRAETPVAMITKKLTTPLPPPGTFRDGLNDDVERVILRALARDPDARFDSCCAMAQQFTEALNGISIGIRSTPASPDDPTIDSLPLVESATRSAHTAISPRKSSGWRTGILVALGIVVAGGAIYLGLFAGRTPNATQEDSVVVQGESAGVAETSQSGDEGEISQTTAITLTSTKTRTPTDTPTPVQFTSTGMPLYDDFEGDELDTSRWPYTESYHVENGELVLTIIEGQEFNSETWLRILRPGSITRAGQIRYAVEFRLKVGPSAANSSTTGMGVFIDLTWPDDWRYNIGYINNHPNLVFMCNLAYHGEFYFSKQFGTALTDEWHTFRITIEEIPDSDDLVLRSYIDEDLGCEIVPQPGWQEIVVSESEISFSLGNYWSGGWDVSEPFQAYFDDIAIGIPNH